MIRKRLKALPLPAIAKFEGLSASDIENLCLPLKVICFSSCKQGSHENIADITHAYFPFHVPSPKVREGEDASAYLYGSSGNKVLLLTFDISSIKLLKRLSCECEGAKHHTGKKKRI